MEPQNPYFLEFIANAQECQSMILHCLLSTVTQSDMRIKVRIISE